MRLLLSLFLFFSVSNATILIDEYLDKVDAFQLEYFYDDSNRLDIQSVQKEKFQHISNKYTFGYKEGTFWFRFKIQNHSPQDNWILLANEPYFDEVTLYTKEGKNWKTEKNGLQILLKDKTHYYHKPLFILDFKQQKTNEYYIKVRGKLTTANDFKLWSQSYFNSIHGYCTDLYYTLFLGALIVVFLLNLFIYYRLKETMYLFYSAYILFYALWIYAYSGLALYGFVDGNFYDFLVVIPFYVMFLVLFSTQFLNIKAYAPQLYNALNYLGYTFLFFAVMIVVEFNPWYQYTIYAAIVVFISMMITASYLLFKLNDINTKLYLFIMSIYLVSILMLALMVNGFIENNDITRYAFLYTSLFEIIFFTAILTNRFYIFHKEKLLYQSQVIQMQEKVEEELEAQIKVRTNDVIELLQDKELLLKELYHRVKNNFQNIVGILWMEAEKSNDAIVKDTFFKLISRIKSMSLIHQFLYEHKMLSHINAKEHIENIVDAIENIYEEEKISIITKVVPISLSINDANNIAIVINEVINNAIKHANLGDKCEIKLNLKEKDNQLILLICDNGNGFDYEKAQRGLGLSLIEQFVQKLNQSQYRFYNQNGTCFELIMELESSEKTSLTSS